MNRLKEVKSKIKMKKWHESAIPSLRSGQALRQSRRIWSAKSGFFASLRITAKLSFLIFLLQFPAPRPVLGGAQSNPAQSSVPDVGRENPFASIPRVIKPLPQSSASPVQPSQLGQETPELFLETIILRFLNAKNLEGAVKSMCSQYGSLAVDEKTNSLIICDTKEDVTRILTEIKKIDKRPQQIMVEVVILDVQLKDDTEIGINWDLLSDERNDMDYRQNFTTSRLKSTIKSDATIGDATAFNTTGTGGEISIIIGTVRNVLHMIQEKRGAEIIASPRAMVVSGQSANIKAVEEIPYKEVSDTAAGGVGALTSTKFKEVGVNLQVTATLTDDNDIYLTVDTEQNVKTSESSGVPVVDTRKANTSLLLEDGQVVIMGGLRRQEKTKEVDQIPILGDLPIIGELFKNTKTVINNSELIVLLSPHIYKGEPVPDDTMAKYNEIKKSSMRPNPDERDKGREDRLEAVDQ